MQSTHAPSLFSLFPLTNGPNDQKALRSAYACIVCENWLHNGTAPNSKYIWPLSGCCTITMHMKILAREFRLPPPPTTRELKHQTIATHGAQPKARFHKFCFLRMSHGSHVSSRKARRHFSRPCRFATTLRISGHFCIRNTVSCSDKDKEKSP